MPGSSQAANKENMNWDCNLDVDTLIENVENEPQMHNPPVPDASTWFSTWSDVPQSSWVTPIERVGLPWHPTTQDSFFAGVHIMHSPTNKEMDDDDDDDDDALESSAQMDRPRSSAYMERPTRSEHIHPPRSSVQLDRPTLRELGYHGILLHNIHSLQVFISCTLQQMSKWMML